jgi:2-polyprenyl-3-methyl-5-hydroxy-6-metoxy-1,4-benzoquinol methylase
MYSGYLKHHLKTSNSHAIDESKVSWFSHNHTKWLPENRQAKILDIGPGAGDTLKWLHFVKKYEMTFGVDISEEVAEHVNRSIPDCTISTSNTTEFLQTRADSFDLILLMHVLEHIPRDQTVTFLKALLGALRVDGRLILEVPNMANPIVASLYRYSDFTHETGFTKSSLEYVMRLAGFEQIHSYPGRVPLTSIGRFGQRLLQTSIENIAGFAMRAYMPSARQITSAVLCCTAIRREK